MYLMLYSQISAKRAAWIFFKNIKDTLTLYGLDDVIFRRDDAWYDTFLRTLDLKCKNDFVRERNTMTSLQFYKHLKDKPFLENYLKTECDFAGQRLKLEARLGCFGLQTDLERRGESPGARVMDFVTNVHIALKIR